MLRLLPLLLTTFLCTRGLAQELSFFESFVDHAVLQRGVEHPVWGWAKPGAKVTLTYPGGELEARADKQTGRWEVRLPPQTAGGPHQLTVRTGNASERIEDVYFGDVYLLSGQSNMEWRLAQSDLDGTRAEAIRDPLIRELKVDKTYASSPQQHLQLNAGYGNSWIVGGAAEGIREMSGVGSYFAHYLRQEVDVPIGLLHASWGGSRIEPWMTAEALGEDALRQEAKRADALAAAGEPGRKKFRESFPGRELPTQDKGEELGWLRDNFNDADWPTMTLPTFWESAGYPSVDGYFYFRRDFTLTPEQAASPITLHLGAIDDGDYTYVNGQLVGSYPNAYSTPRVYEVGANLLRPGKNTLAFRIYDGFGGGGFSASPAEFYARTATGKISLAGDYRYNIGEYRVDAQPNQVPIILYNAMIAPLEGLPLAGVLWYQGESNAGTGANTAYADQMKGLIRQWRGHFTHPGTLPFYWVQLANYQPAPTTADEPGWAIIRQSQTEALSEPVTGMAVITDIGEADDIHPKNKWEVGRRLSLLALRDVYGQGGIANSPSVKQVLSLPDNPAAALLSFTDAPAGLMVKSTARYPGVDGFTVQDTDGEWSFAGAVLYGKDQVLVTHPTGRRITRVRYNWANNPGGNLFSKAGLPVNGFDAAAR